MQDELPFAWVPKDPTAFESLATTRAEVHMGALVLGSVAHALIEHENDDSHANLGLDLARRTLCTRTIGDGWVLHFDVEGQALRWDDSNGVRGGIGLVGKSLSQLLAHLSAEASEFLGRGVGIPVREYPDFPDHPILNGERFEARPQSELSELFLWFRDGLAAFEGLGKKERALSSIRVWPHHFDLGCLLPFRSAGPDVMIGWGFSPGDEHIEQPYFYASPYPQPDPEVLPGASHGFWHTEGFVSQILKAEDLRGAEDAGELVRAYMEEALASARKLLL